MTLRWLTSVIPSAGAAVKPAGPRAQPPLETAPLPSWEQIAALRRENEQLHAQLTRLQASGLSLETIERTALRYF